MQSLKLIGQFYHAYINEKSYPLRFDFNKSCIFQKFKMAGDKRSADPEHNVRKRNKLEELQGNQAEVKH